MFTDGLKKGHPYGEIPPCIHVGILNFNQMISPNYYHKFSLMDEKTKVNNLGLIEPSVRHG